jgi:hypothetical protein
MFEKSLDLRPYEVAGHDEIFTIERPVGSSGESKCVWDVAAYLYSEDEDHKEDIRAALAEANTCHTESCFRAMQDRLAELRDFGAAEAFPGEGRLVATKLQCALKYRETVADILCCMEDESDDGKIDIVRHIQVAYEQLDEAEGLSTTGESNQSDS